MAQQNFTVELNEMSMASQASEARFLALEHVREDLWQRALNTDAELTSQTNQLEQYKLAAEKAEAHVMDLQRLASHKKEAQEVAESRLSMSARAVAWSNALQEDQSDRLARTEEKCIALEHERGELRARALLADRELVDQVEMLERQRISKQHAEEQVSIRLLHRPGCLGCSILGLPGGILK